MFAPTAFLDRSLTRARSPVRRLRSMLRTLFSEIIEKAETLDYLDDVGGL